MKIAGRVFRNDNIISDTGDLFEAIYRKHRITIRKVKGDEYGMKDYYIDVRTVKGVYVYHTTVTRCQIRDALSYALNETFILRNTRKHSDVSK